MNEALLSGGERPRRINKDVGPTELPEVQPQLTPVDKEAITERILDRVIDAAEHDQPLESEYERSHEIKDQENTLFVPMQSIGAILEEQQQSRRPSSNQFINPSFPDNSSHLMPTPIKRETSYKQAIVYGFSVAAMVVLGTGIYLLIK